MKEICLQLCYHHLRNYINFGVNYLNLAKTILSGKKKKKKKKKKKIKK